MFGVSFRLLWGWLHLLDRQVASEVKSSLFPFSVEMVILAVRLKGQLVGSEHHEATARRFSTLGLNTESAVGARESNFGAA